MGKINQETHFELYQEITIGNLRRQFDLLRDLVSVGLAIPGFKINLHIVNSLHAVSSVHLVESPGQFREEEAWIHGSDHEPASPERIAELMRDFVVSIHQRWDEDDKYILAAFVLWRLVWIHPFEDGNGRTARALAYLVICLKTGNWLPGELTMLRLIKDSAEEYLAALRHADHTEKSGSPDGIAHGASSGEISPTTSRIGAQVKAILAYLRL
jgi:hypothetical protein